MRSRSPRTQQKITLPHLTQAKRNAPQERCHILSLHLAAKPVRLPAVAFTGRLASVIFDRRLLYWPVILWNLVLRQSLALLNLRQSFRQAQCLLGCSPAW
ncbi:unnamed protein product [Durusdinium trenchii]|uniref:Uncharacterized protein n=1 Tax=Durusdinium trenchii TaxID=1381693 RepID=A0ABP0JLD4_9DINO